jgi:adenylate cyclase
MGVGMTARLCSLSRQEVFTLEAFNLIGRSESATICLRDEGVSRQHATIRRQGGQYWLADLGSANGTYVNDLALTQAQLLRHGDRLQFGSARLMFAQADLPEMTESIGMRTTVLPRQSVPIKTVRATLLVADLKGYTTLSATLSATDLAEVLKEWYRRCRSALSEHGATIDKFIGDCVFAYWRSEDSLTRQRAVQAARALRATTNLTGVIANAGGSGMALECCVGLHVGEVALGAMDSGINTALGDAVNLAFRIESLTRKLECGVLASAAFITSDADIAPLFTSHGDHDIKGHPQKIAVYALKEHQPAATE